MIQSEKEVTAHKGNAGCYEDTSTSKISKKVFQDIPYWYFKKFVDCKVI